jgi:hypothetical protein
MKGFVRALSYVGAFALVASAAACTDPTTAGVGTPINISPNFISYNAKSGTQFTLTAHLLDAELNSLGTKVDATIANTVLIKQDSAPFVPEINETRFFLKPSTVTKLDSTNVTLSAAGLTKVVKIYVSP